MKIANIRTNTLGTISFTALFNGMRKSQEFTVVYRSQNDDFIRMQSKNRYGTISRNGNIDIALASNLVAFMASRKRYDTIDNMEELLQAIKVTKNDTNTTLPI